MKKGVSKAVIIIVLMLLASSGWTQTSIIKGLVIDSEGEAVIGASILVKGTSEGTVTDLDGRFSLVPEKNEPAILQISYIGLKTVEITVQPGQTVYVTMENSSVLLEEVVVTGYGNFKKSSYTGAASVVSMDKLQDIPAVSIAQMLEAQIPGVTITANTGQPGAFHNIRIRGTGSFNASNEPLFVLDGVPIMSGNMSEDVNNPGGLDLFATLNPADVESITVLKDATSTSLYGARGANGVILITTKKGKEGKTNYSLKANWGMSDFAMQYRPIMGGEERRELIYEGYVNERLIKGDTREQAEQYANDNIDTHAGIPEGGYSDWIDALLKKGNLQNYEFSATGGKENSNFSASLGYTKESGFSLSTDFERYTGRLNYNNTYKKFTLGMNSFFTLTENNMTPESSYYASAIYSSRYELTSSIPIYNPDGTYNTGFYSNNGGYNPLFEDANSESFTRVGRLLSSANISYEIVRGLKLATVFNLDYTNNKEFRYWGPESFDGRSTQGAGQIWRPERLRYNSNSTLNLVRTFNKLHNLNATAAFEVQSYQIEMLYSRATTYGQKTNHTLSNAMTPVSIDNYRDNDRQMSYVARFNYDYANKYYISAGYRHDGSSRLSPNERWGDFWSVSGSWRVTGESFMESAEWLSDLKLKASYGVNGTLPTNYYGYMGTYSSSIRYGTQTAISEYRIANEDLTWEKGYMANIGFDAIFLGRFSLTADLYQRDTKDLLMDKPVYAATGFVSVLDNVGHIRNRGFEIEASSVNINNRDFRWNTSLLLSSNKSKIIKTTEEHTEFINGRLIHREGEAYNTIYVLEYAGVDPETGEAQYYDNRLQEDGTLSKNIVKNPGQAFRICIKDPAPNLAGSLNNTFSYKFIDLSFNLSFTLGGWSVDNALWALQDDGYWDKYNKSTELRRRWQNPGDITDVPRYVNGNGTGGWYSSSRAVHSRDHLRLKTLAFGLSAPRQWINSLGLTKARIYFSGNNLLTWAAYDQYDPELGPQVNWNVPPTKTLSIGVELNF
ncbi:MAG: TonB-dependent receptor [Tannerella sp.]|jgi:TonB-linked SusC/RagA family outer membrane protein|nr:TonB-dependent receptor [Tannerella sp.]